MGKKHAKTGKLKLGPGGMHCPCCSPLPPSKFKKFSNRYERRKGKQSIPPPPSKPD